MRPTHIIEGNLLYSMVTNEMLISLKNTLTEKLKIMHGHIFRYYSPVNLTQN